MKTCLALTLVIALCGVAPLHAGAITGEYVEARTCDVWTGACYANAEMNLTGKHAVLAWKVEKGTLDGVALDGLGVLAIVEATDTLGLAQTGPSKAVILVDRKANTTQRDALVALAMKQGGSLTRNVLRVDLAPIELSVTRCKEGGCALVDAGVAKIETRCLHKHDDKICGHEENYYPPLTKGVDVRAAMLLEHRFTGKGFDKTWSDSSRRGAYIGRFSVPE